MNEIPKTQYAVQLVGPGDLILNKEKQVYEPGPYQILAKTEAVGLCFSDMKLLKQFGQHVRKSEVLSGVDPQVLAEFPSYVPGAKPTVPGHEVVCRIIKVGGKVEHYKPGERWIIQADYRALKTAGSNGAFGYNFEGGLQEYILLDERVVGDPAQEDGYMIRVGDDRGASQSALVEPWACVENSYVTPERQGPLPNGRMLVVGPEERAAPLRAINPGLVVQTTGLNDLEDESFDDIIFFGSSAHTLEKLSSKLAKGAIMNVVLCHGRLGRPVEIGVGRIHYGGTRWIGTVGSDPMASYATIPATGEVRENDHVLVIGAGGPMGQMHVIRDLGLDGVGVVAADVDEVRLAALSQKVSGKSGYRAVLSKDIGLEERFSYVALMAPVPALLVDAIRRSAPGGIVNVFAGIPAPVKHPIDLDLLIENRIFVFGTSGSEPRDMRLVLQKVVEGRLDTNASVAAVSGMAGATEGLAAVENRTMEGKIIVYPMLHDMPLIPLTHLSEWYPTVAGKLQNGQWTLESEQELLEVAGGK